MEFMQRMGQVTEGGSMSFYFASKFSTLSLFIIRIVFTLSVLVNLMASLWYERLIVAYFKVGPEVTHCNVCVGGGSLRLKGLKTVGLGLLIKVRWFCLPSGETRMRC